MTFSVVAIAYRPSTAATTLCCLEAAGFDVFCPGFHTANTLPHYALALGGIPLTVPHDQAGDALDFLQSIPAPGFAQNSVMSMAANCLGWLGFGISSPWPDLLLIDASKTSA